MLHIVKQFMFGITCMLKFEFTGNGEKSGGNEQSEIVEWLVDATNSSNLKAELRNKILSFINTVDKNSDSIIDESEKLWNKSTLDEIIIYVNSLSNDDSQILTTWDINAHALEFAVNLLKVSTDEIDETTKKSKIGLEELKKSQYTSPKLEESAILEGLRRIKLSWWLNRETIGIYEHNGEEKEIILKKDGLGKFFIELDKSTGIFSDDISSKTTNIANTEEVIRLVSELTSGAVSVQSIEKNEVVNDIKNENIKTLEKTVKGSNEKIAWISIWKLTKNEVLAEMHLGSLNNLLLLNNKELNNLVNDLKTALWEEWNDIANFTYRNIVGLRNYSKAITVLENATYKVKWGFLGTVEAMWVIGTLNWINETQKLLTEKTDFKEKLKIIFDYNADGILDSENHFYTKEVAIFKAVKNENDFNNLISNLTNQTGEEFMNGFDTDYYKSRETFKKALANRLDNDFVLDPALMIADPKAQEKFNIIRTNISDKVNASINDKEVEANIKTKFIADLETELAQISDPKKREEIKKELINNYWEVATQLMKNIHTQSEDAYLQSVTAVVHGATWAAATFNIQAYTKDLIDTASVGIINGVLGFQIWKTVFDWDRTKISVWLVNFIPYVAGTQKIYAAEMWKITMLDQTHVENGYDTILWGGVSSLSVVWVHTEKVDETTPVWIEKMTGEMRVLITKVVDSLVNDKEFESLGLEGNDQNKRAYDRIKATYLAWGWNNSANIKALIDGTVNNYERELYRDSKWLNLTWMTIGIIGSNLPFIWLSGWYTDQNWSVRTERVITHLNYQKEWISEIKRMKWIDDVKALDLYNTLEKYKDGFTHGTRLNKGAEKLLTPWNDTDTKWSGLLQLSTFRSLRKFWLENYLNTITNKTEKEIIISTLSQWTRTGWNVEKIINDKDKNNSEKIEKLIELDAGRRKTFESQFGFSSKGLNDEYNAKLRKSGVINTSLVQWVAFDAVSTLNVEGYSEIKNGVASKWVKWVDLLQANLSMIADKEWTPITVEIDKSNHAAFIKTIQKELGIHNADKIKVITDGLNDGSISLYFYKDPEGYDDRIVLMQKQKPKMINQSVSAGKDSLVGVNKVENEYTFLNIVALQDKDINSTDWKEDSDNTSTTPTTGWENTTGTDLGAGWFDPNAHNTQAEILSKSWNLTNEAAAAMTFETVVDEQSKTTVNKKRDTDKKPE